jgi:hypothetical protein
VNLRDALKLLLTEPAVAAEGYRAPEDFLGELLLDGSPVDPAKHPGIANRSATPITLDVLLDAPFVVCTSTPHYPSVEIRSSASRLETEDIVLDYLNPFCGFCVVLHARGILPFEIRFRGPNGEDTLFAKAIQQGFDNEYPNARVVWKSPGMAWSD